MSGKIGLLSFSGNCEKRKNMIGEEEICTRISDNVKMAGFLEKKGKMKLVSPWKKYWFVLEERLLLYYRSQIEYINLSPCRGSLNMGLVSTVRPGSSQGPCIIHVITRTQVVQLRAKDRAAQEEWLQALLDSMALPIVPKCLKPPAGLHCLRYSMDNIPMSEQMKRESEENHQGTLPFRRNHIGGVTYGGSLDAATWSKKCRPIRSPSPNIPKGKMLERILGYVEEVDDSSLSETHSVNEPIKEISLSDGEEKELKCKLQDENRNDFYSVVDKSKKKIRRAVSDNELVTESTKKDRNNKEESRFEKIKNVISRKGSNKPKAEKPNGVKKRRQSFLQKVFKRHHKKRDNDVQDDESDFEDPLYDTIDNVQEQKENLTKPENSNGIEEAEDSKAKSEQLYTEVQKPIFGSKSILTAQAMSELKNKLKSRESLEGQEIEIVKDKPEEVESELFEAYQKIKRKGEIAPALPPRRASRPRSPWHDVPSNNSSINEGSNSFNPHQAQVRFHDELPILVHQSNEEFDKDGEEDKESISQVEGENNNNNVDKKKEDDLTILLEKLTDITTAPLITNSSIQKNNHHSCSLDSDIFKIEHKVERRFSDPDYDIPRPHRLVNICASVEIDKISATQFLGKSGDTSESSSSFPSMEPDSLEAQDKEINCD